MGGNAGAGGVFLASACDYVIASQGTIFNPHYKGMGLYGSEFWTYIFPKRVGKVVAMKIINNTTPINAHEAQKIGLIDCVVPRKNITRFLSNKLFPDLNKSYNALIQIKMEKNHKSFSKKPLLQYREEELA